MVVKLLLFKYQCCRQILFAYAKKPLKLINMCKICIQDTYSKVRIEEETSAAFKNKTGLK